MFMTLGETEIEAHWRGTAGGSEGKEAISTGDSLKGHIRATGYREGKTFN